jgi:hydroxyacylglutathione hydrolase
VTAYDAVELGACELRVVVTGGLWKENCYLVRDRATGAQVIIDPGGEADLIIERLDGGNPPSLILLTHAHHDHVGAVAALARRYSIQCVLHKNDSRLLRHAPMYAWRFTGSTIEPPAPVRTYEGQPMFTLGGRPITVIHTPGHTSGSVCYDFGEFLFTGDTLLYRSVGRTDLPGGDRSALVTSVDTLLAGLAPETLICPGHGRPFSAGLARAWWAETGAAAGEFGELRTDHDY